MDKSGQIGIFLGIMLLLISIAITAVCTPVLKEFTEDGRTDMHCDYTNLSFGERSGCLVMDIFTPLFAIVVLGAGIAGIYWSVQGG